VRFRGAWVAAQITWVNFLSRFSSLRYGGVNYGALGFDADTNVTMTILSVSRYEVRYNVTTTIPTPVHTYVYYQQRGSSPTAVGADKVSYDPGTKTATVTTTGNGVVVTLRYASMSTDVKETGGVMSQLLPLVVLAVIFSSIGRGSSDIKTKIVAYTLVIAALMLIAMVFSEWGY